MRVCNTCGVEYEPFGQRAARCRPCKRSYDRKLYKNKSTEEKRRKIELQTERKKRISDKYNTWKSDKGCSFCEENDAVCLDLHHLDSSDKEISLSDGLRCGWTFERLMEEAAKCIVVCSNCHRKIHANKL